MASIRESHGSGTVGCDGPTDPERHGNSPKGLSAPVSTHAPVKERHEREGPETARGGFSIPRLILNCHHFRLWASIAADQMTLVPPPPRQTSKPRFHLPLQAREAPRAASPCRKAVNEVRQSPAQCTGLFLGRVDEFDSVRPFECSLHSLEWLDRHSDRKLSLIVLTGSVCATEDRNPRRRVPTPPAPAPAGDPDQASRNPPPRAGSHPPP